MQRKWLVWNRRAQTVLWALVILGIVAALPVGYSRWQMEKTGKQIEYVMDYRDLVQIASYQAHPQQFLDEQLAALKESGVTTMAVFESSLQELSWAGKISFYNSAQAAELEGRSAPRNENFTYILFSGTDVAETLSPAIESTFKSWDIPVSSWSFDGNPGLKLETPVENAILKQMEPNRDDVQKIHDAGFRVLPRLSDRIPFSEERTADMLSFYKGLGVTRVLFDGNAVKGYADNAKDRSLYTFANLLNENGIGITTIENTKVQKGFNTLAYLLHYNVVRLYSLSEVDANGMSPEAIADRFHLAAKDRSIRMFYLNGAPMSNPEKAMITDPIKNIAEALAGNDDGPGAIERLSDLGFVPGAATAFEYESPSWHKPLRAVVALGAIAFIALLIQAFIPGILIPVFILGLIGSAGLYVLSHSVFEQALALGASISAPTLAIIWAIRRVMTHTVGSRRTIGGEADSGVGASVGGLRWFFPGINAGRRLSMALALFVATAIISFAGIPYVVGLLNNITYHLVLEQFRGVSLLHLAPIGLAAIYVFLYTGESVWGNLRKLLSLKITVFGVVAVVVIGAAGMYYLSRTGNEGQTTALETVLRNTLENTFGVRPRNKEFLFAHPLYLLGLFLALRYRAAWVLFIVGVIGQLSMVDTFAHIHTALHISMIRDVLGLVLGAIIGLVLIVIWQVLEGVWRRWAPRVMERTRNARSGA